VLSVLSSHQLNANNFAVSITILAVLLENSGLMKAGPRTSEFEPQEGKTVKFSDVHGVDEAKEVCSVF
jgi:ATP-dependent Zn protease